MIQILQIPQNSEEWFEFRADKVTGSNADILLTLGIKEAITRNSSKFTGNYYTQRGHILEPEAIEIYEKIYEVSILHPGIVINTKYPNASCSPDGTLSDTLIEVKCFNEDRHLAIKTIKDIPFKTMAQLQFNMLICGLKKADLIMYNPDIEDDSEAFRVIHVKYNKDTWKNIKNKLGVK